MCERVGLTEVDWGLSFSSSVTLSTDYDARSLLLLQHDSMRENVGLKEVEHMALCRNLGHPWPCSAVLKSLHHVVSAAAGRLSARGCGSLGG